MFFFFSPSLLQFELQRKYLEHADNQNITVWDIASASHVKF